MSRIASSLRTIVTGLAALAMSASAATGQQDPAAAWTGEKRAAIIFVEMANRKGTGFLVRSERGVLYVLTAAHNIFGVVDPSAAGPGGSAVPLNRCQPVNESTIKLRLETTGGTTLYADCIIYLGGPDIGAVRIKPPTQASRLPLLQLGRYQSNAHQRLALLGFAFGNNPELPTAAQLNSLDGPRGTVILAGMNAGGLSGAPYMSSEGLVVGVHSGVLTDEIPRQGYAAMVPLSAAASALEDNGLNFLVPTPGVTDPPPGPIGVVTPPASYRIWGQVLIRDGRIGQGPAPPPRPAGPADAIVRVDFRYNESAMLRSVERSLLPDGGMFDIPCPDGYPPQRESEVRPVASIASEDYVPRSARLTCAASPPVMVSGSTPPERQLSLTEIGRYAATELDDAFNKRSSLLPRLPSCMKTPAGVLDALYCARVNRVRLDALGPDLDGVEENFTNAIANTTGGRFADLRRSALVRYARFQIQRGKPCEASISMAQAVSGASGNIGNSSLPSVVSEWADTTVACAKLQLGLDRFSVEQSARSSSSQTRDQRIRVTSDGLRFLSETAESLTPDTLNAARPRLAQILIDIVTLLSAPKWDPQLIGSIISEETELLRSWSKITSDYFAGSCRGFSRDQLSRPISAQISALQSPSVCSVSGNAPGRGAR